MFVLTNMHDLICTRTRVVHVSYTYRTRTSTYTRTHKHTRTDTRTDTQVHCSIRKLLGRVWSSNGLSKQVLIFPESSKHLYNYMFIIPEQNM